MQLWATARYDYRLTDAEFWGMTPAMFFALRERATCHLEVQDIMVAQICANLWNSQPQMGKRKRKPAKWEDFTPDRRGKRKAEKAKAEAQPWQQQLAIVKVLHAQFSEAFKAKAQAKAKAQKRSKAKTPEA